MNLEEIDTTISELSKLTTGYIKKNYYSGDIERLANVLATLITARTIVSTPKKFDLDSLDF